MSKFLSPKYSSLVPYTPGEQPKAMKYIKLNTNESPFPPSKKAQEMAKETLATLQLYSDPEVKALKKSLAEKIKDFICRVHEYWREFEQSLIDYIMS